MKKGHGKFALLFLILLLVTLSFYTLAIPSSATTLEIEQAPLRTLHVFEEPDGKHVVCALDGTHVELSDELHIHPADGFTYVPPPANFRQPTANSATINVTYTGFTPEAQAAFQFAVDIWQSQITSDVPIEIEASFEPLSTGVLGSAGSPVAVRNWTTGNPPPVSDTWYPIPLANKIAGVDLIPESNTSTSSHDITARFSSVRNDWYFGTDGNTPSRQIDFVSVVLHEIGHGLGFSGSATVSGGEGSLGGNGSIDIYDRFVENAAGNAISSFPNPSTALGAQLQGGDLFFDGSTANAGNNGSRPELYAPNPFRQGSSYAHLDEAIFAPGNPNSLMSPSIASGEAIHDPGAITLGMFTDMGWTTSDSGPTATPTRTRTPIPTRTPTPTITPGGPTLTPTPTAGPLYLPRVMKEALPTLTPTPTPTPIPAMVPITNGNFESGRTGWSEVSSNEFPLIFDRPGLPSSIVPRSGSWLAWLGGANDEIAYIEQEVSIPSNAPHFTYWYWVVSEDSCGNDRGAVVLNGRIIADIYELCSSTETNGWQARSVDLSAFAGQTVLIQIRAETDDNGIFSNLFIDDVAFSSSSARAAEPNQATPSEWDVMAKQDVMPQGSEASYLTPLLRLNKE